MPENSDDLSDVARVVDLTAAANELRESGNEAQAQAAENAAAAIINTSDQ